jgi:hypothetical protein
MSAISTRNLSEECALQKIQEMIWTKFKRNDLDKSKVCMTIHKEIES